MLSLNIDTNGCYKIGLDIGSTTIKVVVIDEDCNIVYSSYERHLSQIASKTIDILHKVKEYINSSTRIAISGSAGLGIAQYCNIQFVQEVYATRVAINKFIPGTDVVIELGGEDAKILFLSGNMEVRMNGTCAGGTGAFIDQMATLLNVPIEKMNNLAKNSNKVYTIASRCGVFAKTDIQPLINQGAQKNDIVSSIFHAVVNQTLSGLAQGRKISGKVVYLGGPLTFMPKLRESFDKELKLNGICPEDSLYYVAVGTALCATTYLDIDIFIHNINKYRGLGNFAHHKPLFNNRQEYNEFLSRHNKNMVPESSLRSSSEDKVYLGIDAGSTTVKAVLINDKEEVVYSKYLTNNGNPVDIIKGILCEIYNNYPKVEILSSAACGYGEEIIKSAFNLDFGIVETIAHFISAKKFMPDVDFVIDIGGQDIKCFKIHNQSIDNIFLNEACSSGCGSFLQAFANALGYSIEEFAKLGLFAKAPVDLGSRCTVFMNSSVKQAQKEGAKIEDISAGLSLSVVKNALYKVIRASSAEDIGKKIVVQGGTFFNDAVLRAFEQETGAEVIRPNIAGLMGAYGAALYAKSNKKDKSSLMNRKSLLSFDHKVKNIICSGCNNHCRLNVNMFSGGKNFISGNRCQKPITGVSKTDDNGLNIYDYKLRELAKYTSFKGKREVIGIPMGLNMYELLPFWHTFFKNLDFGIEASSISNRDMYILGQQSIPSDTVCFPAKLIHGHVQSLINKGLTNIFYPCMTYNLNEHMGDNNYNCPVVAYYPEVINANISDLDGKKFINDYIGLHNEKEFPIKMTEILSKYYENINLKDVKLAAKEAYKEQKAYMERIGKKGKEIIDKARGLNKKIMVLAGRPYHLDPEINHGIDKLIENFGCAIVSEDAVYKNVKKIDTKVLNQWTYHSRLYAAAEYVSKQNDMNLIQLVSFGCGVDAITTDEVRSILESNNKIYTQIKIDEITNLGAVKIRIRSLLAAIERKI